MNMVTSVKVDQVLGYFAAGQVAKKSAIVDMAGYEGVMFIFEFGTILNTGTLACEVNGNTTNATGGTKLAGGKTVTVNATTAALTQSCVVIDIYQPEPSTSRYLEAMVTPGVANAVILGITAIRYGGKVKPELTDGLLGYSFIQSPGAAA